MKSAKLFLAGMYLHLLLSIAIPMCILFLFTDSGWNGTKIGLMGFYLIAVAAVWLLGWVTAGMAAAAYRRQEIEKRIKGWKLLKLGSIPFYIINFLYSFLFWMAIVGGSRGVGIFLVPIPLFVTCSMIVQSGCLGVCCIKLLRKQNGSHDQPPKVHYLLQLLPVLDVISTGIILRRYKDRISKKLN